MSDTIQNTPAEPGTITLVQAAALLQLTPNRLRQLAAGGYRPMPVRGRVPLVAVVQGYIRFMRSEARRTVRAAAGSRVADARAEEIEIRNAQRFQRLVDEALQEAIAVVDEAAGGLKADLMSIPARVTKDIPLRRRIETEFTEAFRAAAARSRKAAEEAQR